MNKTRRQFLKTGTVGLAAGALSPLSPVLSQAMAQSPAGHKTLINIYLGGGADGLQIIMPTGPDVSDRQLEGYSELRPANYIDPSYTEEDDINDPRFNHSIRYGSLNVGETGPKAMGFVPHKYRDGLNLDASRTPLSLDGFFELNPALAELHSLYVSGDLAFIPGVGNFGSRSHFEAKDGMMSGAPRNIPSQANKVSGWLHDSIAVLDEDLPNVSGSYGMPTGIAGERAISLHASPSQAFSGIVSLDKVVATSSIRHFTLDLSSDSESKRSLLQQLYNPGHNDFAGITSSGDIALNRVDDYQDFTDVNSPNYAVYENAEGRVTEHFYRQLAEIALMLETGTAPDFIDLTFGGWDTHDDQWERTKDKLSVLAFGLSRFYNSLSASARANICVLVNSEFGRTLDVNNGHGTDHGYGGTWLVLGGTVRGGSATSHFFQQNWKGLPIPELDGNGNIVTRQVGGVTKVSYQSDPAFVDPTLIELSARQLLRYGIDFRAVYKDILEGFVGINPNHVPAVFNIANDPGYDLNGSIQSAVPSGPVTLGLFV